MLDQDIIFCLVLLLLFLTGTGIGAAAAVIRISACRLCLVIAGIAVIRFRPGRSLLHKADRLGDVSRLNHVH